VHLKNLLGICKIIGNFDAKTGDQIAKVPLQFSTCEISYLKSYLLQIGIGRDTNNVGVPLLVIFNRRNYI
jgi:hypothetical protein